MTHLGFGWARGQKSANLPAQSRGSSALTTPQILAQGQLYVKMGTCAFADPLIVGYTADRLVLLRDRQKATRVRIGGHAHKLEERKEWNTDDWVRRDLR